MPALVLLLSLAPVCRKFSLYQPAVTESALGEARPSSVGHKAQTKAGNAGSVSTSCWKSFNILVKCGSPSFQDFVRCVRADFVLP